MPTTPSTPTTDGRVARRVRNRAAVVDAIVSIVNTGDHAPSMAKVAGVAGVSERSIFRHFETLDTLYAAVVNHQTAIWRSILKGVPPDGPLADRVEALVLERSRLYEKITPMRKAAQRYEDESDAIAAQLAVARRWLRQELEIAFAPELDRHPAADRRDLVTAIDANTTWAAWIVLREQQRCSVARARRVTARILASLLAHP